MSLLSDRDIRRALDNGTIGLTPTNEDWIQPASIDIRLDEEFLVYDGSAYALDPREEQPMRRVRATPDQPFILYPGEFALAATIERVTLGDTIAARLEGKSSMGRLGLLTHATAGFIDPGFDGHVTLELANIAPRPLLLPPGMFIGQLAFFDLSSRVQRPYGANRGSHYQHQRGPTPSRSYLQFARQAGVPTR